jgi:hypothetical protein
LVKCRNTGCWSSYNKNLTPNIDDEDNSKFPATQEPAGNFKEFAVSGKVTAAIGSNKRYR